MKTITKINKAAHALKSDKVLIILKEASMASFIIEVQMVPVEGYVPSILKSGKFAKHIADMIENNDFDNFEVEAV